MLNVSRLRVVILFWQGGADIIAGLTSGRCARNRTEEGTVACMPRSRHATVGIAAAMDRTEAWSAFVADDDCYRDCEGDDDERNTRTTI